jgi:hypothetical protein
LERFVAVIIGSGPRPGRKRSRGRPDGQITSASTKAKKAMLITPFMVKNAASRRRLPGRISECSYTRSRATTATPSQ